MQNYLYKTFKRYFPVIAARAVEWYDQSPDELFARLNNGDCIIYDDMYKTVRTLPSDSKSMTEDECRKELGRRLQRIMIRKGITQTDLAAMTGLQQCMISNYISGKTTPSFYTIDKIAKALDCSIDIFRYID